MIFRITNRMVVIIPDSMVDNNKTVAPGQCKVLNVEPNKKSVMVSPNNI